jgi:hemerythrin-like domain-containing protein
MCEHCGCRGVEPIAQLMDEHLELLDVGDDVRRRLAAGDRLGAWEQLGRLALHLDAHVAREEAGVFAALRAQGEFVQAVEDLEAEHAGFDEWLSDVGLHDADLEHRVGLLLQELSLHIDKENLGIFPVAVVTLDAAGWAMVSRAHETPSDARR